MILYSSIAERFFVMDSRNIPTISNYEVISHERLIDFQCVRNAAERGDIDAQFTLGKCYNNGEGVKQDYTQAVYWYRKAAGQGHAEAQLDLGACYYLGDGVKQDYIQAVYWLRKAAEQGNADAQNNLGNCYYNGHGVKQNYKQAAYWYQKAAEQGHETAQSHLDAYYNKGSSAEQDDTQAVYGCRKAAEQGDETAQSRLDAVYNIKSIKSSVEQDEKYQKGLETFKELDAKAYSVAETMSESLIKSVIEKEEKFNISTAILSVAKTLTHLCSYLYDDEESFLKDISKARSAVVEDIIPALLNPEPCGECKNCKNGHPMECINPKVRADYTETRFLPILCNMLLEYDMFNKILHMYANGEDTRPS